jgi:hypothetical protein
MTPNGMTDWMRGGVTGYVDDTGDVVVEWHGEDWFGRGRFVSGATSFGTDVLCTVRVDVAGSSGLPMLVFRIEAQRDLTGLSTGSFDQPSVGWPVFTPSERNSAAPEGLRAVAFQGCEFGLPTNAGADLDGWFVLPIRPASAWPLIARAEDGRTLMIAPLDHFHEQVLGVNGGTLRCGWHGDLDRVPAGFATELAVIAGPGPRACVDAWGRLLLERAGTVRPGRWADALTSRPSYWTDNGAAYWYRTEPGLDPAGSIVAAVEDLRERGVPIGAVQLDSWWYPHQTLRPFDTDEWIVPPTAMLAWEERPDALPDGIPALRERLGSPPLVAHIRHLAADAPIAQQVPVWVDGGYAAPRTSEPYERWLDQCVAWGVETFEHDWLVEVFYGVRGLREEPGRARAWQEGIDRAARDRGITLQWCMGSPADFAQTTTLTQVTSVRTSGDHGYIATPGQLWAWFCVTNTLARALGLMPFKDVFRADPEVAGDHGEPEALLSALSTGPVGLGDRVGRFDPALALATCRADGVLIKPHVPIAATDTTMLANVGFRRRLLVAECWSDHPTGRWAYVFAAHAVPDDEPLTGTISLAELGESSPSGDVVVWDWRTGTARRGGPHTAWDVTLGREDWAFYVMAPVLDGDLAVIGDVSKFVTAGDARIEVATDSDANLRLVVKGAGETVTVTGWAAAGPTSPDRDVRYDGSTGLWRLDVEVPERGWTSVRVTPRR